MRQTDNLSLNMPEPDDFVDIEDLNENAEILDDEISEQESRIGTLETGVATHNGKECASEVGAHGLRIYNGKLQKKNGNTWADVGSNASLGQGYAVCSTAAATTEKTATIADYSLETGGIVSILFENAVPASATLNISSKGAKAIYYQNAAIVADVIRAGDTATLIYDGARYHVISLDSQSLDDIKLAADLGESRSTTFNANGSITETYSDRIKNTAFQSDGSVYETLSTLDGTTYATKTTTFNSDGSITESVTKI